MKPTMLSVQIDPDKYVDKLVKDERVDIRIPKILKEALESERKRLGYSSLSGYIIGILINRDRP
jgi:hypothetical protein